MSLLARVSNGIENNEFDIRAYGVEDIRRFLAKLFEKLDRFKYNC